MAYLYIHSMVPKVLKYLLLTGVIGYFAVLSGYAYLSRSFTGSGGPSPENIDTLDEYINLFALRCFSYNSGDTMDCRSFDSCNPEIPDRHTWIDYIDENLHLSFRHPPWSTVRRTDDSITISNIKLSVDSSVADEIVLRLLKKSFAAAAQDASSEADALEWTSLPPYENEHLASVGSIGKAEKLYLAKLTSTPVVGWVAVESCEECELPTDDCSSCYVGFNTYLRKTFGEQPQLMLEIQGSDTLPTEWGRVAPYCIDYETPVGVLVNSIRFSP